MSDEKTPLLEIEKLTIRFGGLTAVSEVDLRVESGQIVAVIGPNGAGKTTVFNAVTGIYEPTEGKVKLKGRELLRPVTRSLPVFCGLIGLLVGFCCLLFASNVDRLWLAVVKANFRGLASGFSLSEAWRDFGDYLASEPRVEFRAGKYFVVSNDGEKSFGVVSTPEEAEQRRVLVMSAPDLRASMRASTRMRVSVFILGTLLGMAAALAIWRQTRRTPAWVAAQGLARTFQNIRLFQQMTVLENVMVGMHRHLEERAGSLRLRQLVGPIGIALGLIVLALGLRFQWGAGASTAILAAVALGSAGYVGRIRWLGAFAAGDVAIEQRAASDGRELLRFVGLESHANELAKNLAYGDQRRLEIARALATRPKLLLLDEPAAGMNPAETLALMQLIRAIRDRGVTILLIEHHMRVVMGISDRITVLEYGRKIAEGTPDEVRTNPQVIEAYLGKEELG